MELEKSKEYLKQFSELMKKWEATNISSNIDVVLQALDNSIPKEKIENKLNDIEAMLDKTTKGEVQKYTVGELILCRTIYNELLEEENEK